MRQEVVLIFWLVALLAGVALVWFFWSRRKRQRLSERTAPAAKAPSAPPLVEPAGIGVALQRTRGQWWEGLSKLVGRSQGDVAAAEWEALEETLLSADVSLPMAEQLLARARASEGALLGALRSGVEAIFKGVEYGWEFPAQPRPLVLSLVGVNGVGKTTTAGKLAHRFSQEGKRVLLGACDSFRAAAIQQLRVWADRAGCEFVAGREGADPGATAFDAVSAGKARGMDLVLLDTAGRLHTKSHLMDELARVHKVVKKVIPEAPHQIWLVLDGTLGQNSIAQARQFHETLGLTGVVVTKLDGTSKGGAVLSVAGDLGLPVRFIGTGEKPADLIPFVPEEFAGALFDRA